ncbi:hypothetical protein PAXINDRAFT_8368 [Paxillus involutus ATCC 200175]|nr:hypothetical protein PAXINDRAFT_8368 [Paxillus involutus ATCC 200175]
MKLGCCISVSLTVRTYYCTIRPPHSGRPGPDENPYIEASEKAFDRFGRIDVVFNSAAICVVSKAEGTSDEQGRNTFDVTMLFWGAVNVTKEAIKVFRGCNNRLGLLWMSSRTALKVIPASQAASSPDIGLHGTHPTTWGHSVEFSIPTTPRPIAFHYYAANNSLIPSRPKSYRHFQGYHSTITTLTKVVSTGRSSLKFDLSSPVYPVETALSAIWRALGFALTSRSSDRFQADLEIGDIQPAAGPFLAILVCG